MSNIIEDRTPKDPFDTNVLSNIPKPIFTGYVTKRLFGGYKAHYRCPVVLRYQKIEFGDFYDKPCQGFWVNQPDGDFTEYHLHYAQNHLEDTPPSPDCA